jgi:hypothetical protein
MHHHMQNHGQKWANKMVCFTEEFEAAVNDYLNVLDSIKPGICLDVPSLVMESGNHCLSQGLRVKRCTVVASLLHFALYRKQTEYIQYKIATNLELIAEEAEKRVYPLLALSMRPEERAAKSLLNAGAKYSWTIPVQLWQLERTAGGNAHTTSTAHFTLWVLLLRILSISTGNYLMEPSALHRA